MKRIYTAEELGAVPDAPEADERARYYNDLALHNAIKRTNFDGTTSEWFGHHYYFDAQPPEFDALNGGIAGGGWGTDLVTDSPRGGTHFRYRGTGDFLRLGASNTVRISGLVFWPTAHGDGTQIVLDDRSYRCHLHDLQFHNVNRSISIAGGIFTRIERVHTQSFWAEEAYKITAAPSLANANEDTLFSDVHSISPLRVAIGPQPTSGVAGHVRDRTNGMTVIVGDFARWSGHYFQAEIVTGVTGGSTPTIPTYVTSADRYSMKITDGGVTWAWYCRENAAGARVGSGGNYATFADCKFMQGVHGIESVNDISGGSFAKQLTIRDLVDDHPIGDHVKIGGGRIIEIKSNKLESSALGCAVRMASGCDEFNIHDNFWPDNALGGLINNAGCDHKKIFKNNIPDGNDETISSTPDGRVFANPTIGQIKFEPAGSSSLDGWSIYQEPSGGDLNKVKARNETTGNTASLVVP